MRERGQSNMAITEVHQLSDFWLPSHDMRLVELVHALPHPAYHMVDQWIEATKMNARNRVVEPRCDPTGMPARL